jgi:hypothetical protein
MDIMKIKGKLNRITNIETFAQSFLATGGKPTQGFANWTTTTRVTIATDAPEHVFDGGFLPHFSFDANADAQGHFEVSVPDALAAFKARVIAYKMTTLNTGIPGVPPVPVFQPLYRSEVFALTKVTAAVRDVFLFSVPVHDTDGFSQADIKDIASNLKKDQKLDKISATITSSGVNCSAEKDGGVIRFKIVPTQSTSSNLAEILELRVDDIDIDLPGPDFIVGLCVSKDDIAKRVRDGVKGRQGELNKKLLKKIEDQAPGASAVASITLTSIRFPVTGTTTVNLPGIPPLSIPVLSIVGDPTAGIPKAFY